MNLVKDCITYGLSEKKQCNILKLDSNQYHYRLTNIGRLESFVRVQIRNSGRKQQIEAVEKLQNYSLRQFCIETTKEQ